MKINFEKFKKLGSTGLVLIMLSSPAKATNDKIHIVSKGDTLSEISLNHYGSIKYYDELANYNGIVNSSLIRIGEIIYIPSLRDLLNSSNYSYGYYVMKKGDTLYNKCKEYYKDGSLYKYVGEYNDITNYTNIQIGTPIYFPSLNEILSYKQACNSCECIHVVRKGETLSSISYKYYGTTIYYKEIGDFNNISDYNKIFVGTTLTIPNISKTKVLK